MTKCRNSGEAFIFTVPDKSPLRNCTYLQRMMAQGSHGRPHGSDPTQAAHAQRPEPTFQVLGGDPAPLPTAKRVSTSKSDPREHSPGTRPCGDPWMPPTEHGRMSMALHPHHRQPHGVRPRAPPPVEGDGKEKEGSVSTLPF